MNLKIPTSKSSGNEIWYLWFLGTMFHNFNDEYM